jgi:GTPase involved in cell partitioning and DNA repair
MTGRKGADVFIRVPLGTIVTDMLSNPSKTQDIDDGDDGIEDFDGINAEEFEEEAKWKALEQEIKQEEVSQLCNQLLP